MFVEKLLKTKDMVKNNLELMLSNTLQQTYFCVYCG